MPRVRTLMLLLGMAAGPSAAVAPAAEGAPRPTDVVLAGPGRTIVSGEAAVLEATVRPLSPDAGGTPVGDVVFLEGDRTVATVAVVRGVAALPLRSLPVGDHEIHAAYRGSEGWSPSVSATVAQPVDPARTEAVLTSDADGPAVVGQGGSLVASVRILAPGGGGTPSATIRFAEGDRTLLTVGMTKGLARLPLSRLGVGEHRIVARFSGNATLAPSQAEVITQVVRPAVARLRLTSDADPVVAGAPGALTARVAIEAPGAATATGRVTFTEGGAAVGTATLSGGVARLPLAALGAGVHELVASYPGTAAVTAASAPFTQLVTAAPESGLAGRGVPVTARVAHGGSLSDGVATGVNTRSAHRMACTCGGLRVVWSGWYTAGGDVDGPDPVDLSLSVEYPEGRFTPVAFNGARTTTLAPGATVVSDVVGALPRIPAGQVFHIRAFLHVADGGRWIRGLRANAAPAFGWVRGEGFTSGAGERDGTLEPLGPDAVTEGAMPGPVAVLATTGAGGRPSVASLGDSILFGGLSGRGSPDQSWLTVALADRAGVVELSKAGGSASDFARTGQFRYRLPLMGLASTLVSGLGVNDLNAGQSLAQVEASLSRVWQAAKAHGLKVLQTTITPWTTSDDGWSTVEGQSVRGQESRRVALNRWIRSGAGGSPYLDGYVEIADQVETGRESGRWRPGLTYDGVHPRIDTDALIAAGVDLSPIVAADG